MPTIYNHSTHFYHALLAHNPDSYNKLDANSYFDRCASRVLGSTTPDDILQIEPSLKSEYPYILAHYDQVGIDYTKNVLWDVSLEAIKDFPNHRLSVFLFGDDANTARPADKRYNATRTHNNKNDFIRFCETHNFPVPKTIYGNTDSKPPTYGHLKFPLYLKGAVAAMGSSVMRCVNPQEVTDNLKKVTGEYQLQEEVPGDIFLNVQYGVNDQGVSSHLATTEQILDGVAYVGSRYPSSFDPRSLTDVVAQKLADEGLEDIFGIDVAVTPQGEFVIIECNPRWNGSTYFSQIADRLHIDTWSTATMATHFRSLADIKLDDLAYTASRKHGIILIHWGSIKNGKLRVLFAGTQDQQHTLRMALAKRLEDA
jgi:hypothetical protein